MDLLLLLVLWILFSGYLQILAFFFVMYVGERTPLRSSWFVSHVILCCPSTKTRSVRIYVCLRLVFLAAVCGRSIKSSRVLVDIAAPTNTTKRKASAAAQGTGVQQRKLAAKVRGEVDWTCTVVGVLLLLSYLPSIPRCERTTHYEEGGELVESELSVCLSCDDERCRHVHMI